MLSGVIGLLSDNLSESTSGSHLSLGAVGQTSPAASSLPRDQLQTSGDCANPNLTTTKTYLNKTFLMKNKVLCFLYYISKYFARNVFKNLLTWLVEIQFDNVVTGVHNNRMNAY